MFKTTTVAVDGEKGEDSIDGVPMTSGHTTQRLWKIRESVVLVGQGSLETALPSALVLTKSRLFSILLESHRLQSECLFLFC